jgi:hypothetical protein
MKSEFVLYGSEEDTTLAAQFLAVHEEARSEFHFHRTLRVPNDNNVYSLPAGVEAFPLRHLEDYAHMLPPALRDRGGVIMPMYRGEAMWIRFDDYYPCAIKIGAGQVNVLTGQPWTEVLSGSARDYIVAPPQPALDGFRTDKDEVRQFVAVPLGANSSVDMQMLREAHGGIQIVAYPMKPERFEELKAKYAQEGSAAGWGGGVRYLASPQGGGGPTPRQIQLSVGPGGRLRERIFKDDYGIEAWDLSSPARCIVTLIDAARWGEITGSPTPTKPFTPEAYRRNGLPWFEVYDDGLAALDGESGLDDIATVSDDGTDRGMQVLRTDAMPPGPAIQLRPVRPPRRSRDPRPVVRALWGAIGPFRRRLSRRR